VQVPFAEEIRDPRALRSALIATFRRVIKLYFRDIERLGDPPASDTRGRVFVSNHTNALIDRRGDRRCLVAGGSYPKIRVDAATA
jgi:hypothetical protein